MRCAGNGRSRRSIARARAAWDFPSSCPPASSPTIPIAGPNRNPSRRQLPGMTANPTGRSSSGERIPGPTARAAARATMRGSPERTATCPRANLTLRKILSGRRVAATLEEVQASWRVPASRRFAATPEAAFDFAGEESLDPMPAKGLCTSYRAWDSQEQKSDTSPDRASRARQLDCSAMSSSRKSYPRSGQLK